MGPTQHPAQGVLGLFPEVKRPKRDVNHAPTCRVEAKGRVQLYLYLRLDLNPLNAELNLICHLLALLGAHPILHIGRIRVNGLF